MRPTARILPGRRITGASDTWSLSTTRDARARAAVSVSEYRSSAPMSSNGRSSSEKWPSAPWRAMPRSVV
ncbi:Uncharacterised protein [Mycobacteroides abscessus subsp. abscessus]|nr:Uncharacterised protein [Mycobacteroides abscessus subsp. abscessus]